MAWLIISVCRIHQYVCGLVCNSENNSANFSLNCLPGLTTEVAALIQMKNGHHENVGGTCWISTTRKDSPKESHSTYKGPGVRNYRMYIAGWSIHRAWVGEQAEMRFKEQ